MFKLWFTLSENKQHGLISLYYEWLVHLIQLLTVVKHLKWHVVRTDNINS